MEKINLKNISNFDSAPLSAANVEAVYYVAVATKIKTLTAVGFKVLVGTSNKYYVAANTIVTTDINEAWVSGGVDINLYIYKLKVVGPINSIIMSKKIYTRVSYYCERVRLNR